MSEQLEEVQPQETQTGTRNLAEKDVRPTNSWHEWLAKWDATEKLEDLESILHYGFSVPMRKWAYYEPEYTENDRLKFYFATANGWGEHRMLTLPTDRDKRYEVADHLSSRLKSRMPSELRQRVARKAFDVLCANLNWPLYDENTSNRGTFLKNWVQLVNDDALFETIQNFLRFDRDTFGEAKVLNLQDWRQDKPPHGIETFHAFLVNLANFIWKWRLGDCDYGENQEAENARRAVVRTRVAAARPWMIEVLNEIGRLGVLRKPREFPLDQPCLDKLKEIAMRTKLSRSDHPVPEDRLVKSVVEAAHAGSAAASIFLGHKWHTHEEALLQDIRDAERQKAEAEKKLMSLKLATS